MESRNSSVFVREDTAFDGCSFPPLGLPHSCNGDRAVVLLLPFMDWHLLEPQAALVADFELVFLSELVEKRLRASELGLALDDA